MEEIKKVVLRQVHCDFVKDLDPYYVVDFLYGVGAIGQDVCKEIVHIDIRPDRARMFMFKVAESDKITLDILYEALKSNGYGFLAELLRESANKFIPVQRKAEFFSRFRQTLVRYRHYLKRLSHTGDHNTFEKEFLKAKTNWENISKSGTESKRYKAADIYFFALDAWCEYRRVIYDKKLVDTDVFKTIESLKPYMSEENLPEMMRLARYGSAVLMADKNKLDIALQYIDDAITKFDLLYACRETGTVLYIQYNMLYEKYGGKLTADLKRLLSNIGSRAIEHFSREAKCEEMVYNDFRRMVLLKLSHLYLSVGIFGIYLDADVTDGDKRKAISLLKCIKQKENWSRMETRWKWAYYTARARLFGLENNFENAIRYTNKALLYAKRGGYTKEILGSENALQFFYNKVGQNNLQMTTKINKQMEAICNQIQTNLSESSGNNIEERKTTLEKLNKSIEHSQKKLIDIKKQVQLLKKMLRNLREKEIDLNRKLQNQEEIFSISRHWQSNNLTSIVIMLFLSCCLTFLFTSVFTQYHMSKPELSCSCI